jgi:hypothetical protein
VDASEARSAVAENTKRFADLIRAAPDPEQPIVGSDWCVREVAAHLLVVAEAFERYLTGDTTPVIDVTDLATTNPAAVATVQERDVGMLTERLERAMARFLELTDGRGVDAPMSWHGVDTTVGAVYGIYLGELLLHGMDVARTLRHPWSIDATEATIVFEASTELASVFLDPERARSDATFEVRLRTGPSFVFRFSGGVLSVETGRARDVDCRVSADPVAVVLVLYGRRSQWGEIARGRLVAFGRRPWLAFGFVKRFGGF